MKSKSLLLLIEPQSAFVYFNNVIPGFARINTPRSNWTLKKRTRILSNDQKYIIPPSNEMKGHFVLLHDWKINCKDFSNNKRYSFCIPSMQSTDFASIPRILHSIISPLSNSVYAAVLHDYLYRNPADNLARNLSRKDADRFFYYGMKACGVKILQALTMYYFVRWFGKSSYKR